MYQLKKNVPFEDDIELLDESGKVVHTIHVSLCLDKLLGEVRMLNPRKVFTRVNVELALTPYVPASLSVCSGVKEQEAYKIETLCEKKDIGS